MAIEPGFEHSQLKGITIKNMIVTIICTASIVASVMTTYFNLKSQIIEVRDDQNLSNRIMDIRIKLLESQIIVVQQQIGELQKSKK